ncbi:sensor domain-containing protein [Kitasatospora sp. NPDC048365]|uniref:sensor domain-containing protein n=1 Tax=Kitasatospora sp. NPDC048365 TaxID=3364050 RepID=UPI00370FCEA3
MTTSTLHRADTFHTRPAGPRRPAFWRAPFAASTYRELGFTLTGLPVAIAGFVATVALFSAGLGLVVTALGLPVLALLLVLARGFGALDRQRARTMLDTEVTAPPAVRPKRGGFWGAVTARLADGAGWRAALYQVLMLPWAILSFTLSVVFLTVGWSLALYPLYHWVFARYTPWPGYQLYEYTDRAGVEHHAYVTEPWQITGVSLLGVLLVLLTPQIIRGVTNVSRLAIRGLLGAR